MVRPSDSSLTLNVNYFKVFGFVLVNKWRTPQSEIGPFLISSGVRYFFFHLVYIASPKKPDQDKFSLQVQRSIEAH
jgi:hypothetical protein